VRLFELTKNCEFQFFLKSREPLVFEILFGKKYIYIKIGFLSFLLRTMGMNLVNRLDNRQGSVPVSNNHPTLQIAQLIKMAYSAT